MKNSERSSQTSGFESVEMSTKETPQPASATNKPREPLLVAPAENGDQGNDGFSNI